MSKLEETLALHIRALKLPEPVREYRFHPVRRWRFDFAWPDYRIAAEVEGITCYGRNKNGTLKLGRHQTAKGVSADMEKYAEAMALGWSVFRCDAKLINSGRAVEVITQMMKLREAA
ncbi:endonuclease domain-containing protein [Hahella sp. HN01]|uniref:endonuclease domain-containing protein n=1 Tax=Hahella sp. HN01 TaxID=2847262 RepID=UPI001C1EBAC1|nr:endonuclease domain-containing protein [Hahella sp. HN01]MBU6955892.1 endonuclease domain-containing protein [Hahella sp. HN01]